MYLALNNLPSQLCHKNQPTNHKAVKALAFDTRHLKKTKDALPKHCEYNYKGEVRIPLNDKNYAKKCKYEWAINVVLNLM